MSIFWGLSMKPNRKYTQTIVKSFHLSGVAMDDGDFAKLYITADKTKYTIASLNKNRPQTTLDLNFCKGDKIMFQTTGDATVSLTGYLHQSESDDEDYDEEYEDIAKALQKAKADKDSDSEAGSEEEEEDEDLDDSKLVDEYSSFIKDEESGEDDEEDDESGDEDEEDDSEDEEVPQAKKAKLTESGKKAAKEQNGVVKKEKQEQQPKSKKEKKQAAAASAPEGKKEQPKQKDNKQAAGERTLSGGVKVQDLNAGNGQEAKQGKRVSVYYIGRLKSNNKTFDSMQKGNGFKFALGAGEVIKGWDVGVVGMKVGGKRRITCPPHMAYGARGHPPTIPPNATLAFDVELKAIH